MAGARLVLNTRIKPTMPLTVHISNTDMAVRSVATPLYENSHTTQCYLPPGRSKISAFNPTEAGTRFSDPGRMQGWVTNLEFKRILEFSSVRVP